MIIGERIKKIRKELDLTQQEFSARIGMKRNSIAQIESGRSTSDQTILTICREFKVSEKWIRTGEGEIFLKPSRNDEITEFMERVLKDESDSFRTRFIAMLCRLNESDWGVLEKVALELAKGKGPAALESNDLTEQ